MNTAERDEMIAKIKRLPEIVDQAVAGLNDEQLNTRYREGGWTVRQVVHHLADSHMNAFTRMKLAITEEKPTLKTYDQDEWAKLPDSKTPVAGSLAILRGLHERWGCLLDNLSESDWQRPAYHPERGDITVTDLLKIYANHGEKHVSQITDLRTNRGW